MAYYDNNPEPWPPHKTIGAGALAALAAIAVVTLIVVLGFAGCSASKNWSRAQARKNAENQVQLTHIKIQQAQQQAKINAAQIAATRAEAQKRYEEAIGIRRAQDEIQATLTDRYIQHEAIQAQKAIATSGRNNTVIYVPSGTNGTPTLTASAGTGK